MRNWRSTLLEIFGWSGIALGILAVISDIIARGGEGALNPANLRVDLRLFFGGLVLVALARLVKAAERPSP
jgi:hypothetical protein